MKILRFLLLGIVIFTVSACRFRDPILIGVSVELSGNRGEIGVAIRNGAQLAVEQINASGGINGKELELVVRDDQGDPDIAREVDQELIDLGVIAIIGHVTSQQTEAVYDLVTQSGVILFSPTSSSPFFTGKADNFFRVMPDNYTFGRALGWMIYEGYDIHELVCIREMNNESFTSSLWVEVDSVFESKGGSVAAEYLYRSGEDDLDLLMQEVAAVNPEAILFIAPDTDTALMAQYGRLYGLESQYFSSTWAQTDELIRKGGGAVEGMVISAMFDPNSTESSYLQFLSDYNERFQTAPILGASHAYESVLILAEGLKQSNGQLDGLAEALSELVSFPGVQGIIEIDQFGDVVRNSYFVSIQNRNFETIDVVGSEDIPVP